jgi:DNA-binding SARP family transcriptional activator/Flp pilus assembly protein TadD
MEFGMLGPLVVSHDGVPMPVAGGKQRVVLATLLLAANQVVPVDDLVDVLWPVRPPPSARVTAQNYVKRLRHALAGDGHARIGTQPGGYRIQVRDDELDVSRFAGLVAAARADVKAGDWERASAGAARALALWRGEPLVDVASDVLREREAGRLAELRLQALETRFDAELSLGHHAEVLPELRQCVSAHPLREEPRAFLMLALYRCGRQADALEIYQDARRTLVEAIGAEPGARLRDLQQRILAADPGLDRRSAVPLSETPPETSVPHELPTTSTNFTGRAGELTALTRLLESGAGDTSGSVSVLVITGSPGIGKTALALCWAHRIADRFPDGQLYVNLRGYDPDQPVTAAEALAGFLRALGVPGVDISADVAERAASYRTLLTGRQVLVVLDNAAHVDQIRPLLPAADGCHVLVTSRDSLAGLIAGDGARRLTLDLLPLDDAMALLEALIGDRVAADRPGAAALAGQCARLPLALRIAAEIAVARPGITLADLAGELASQRKRRLDLLDGTKDRHTMVRTVFSWSYRELDPGVARGFSLAGTHPGPDFDRFAFAALTAGTPELAATTLDELTRAHLIQPAGHARHGMHDLLRAYASERAHEDHDNGQDTVQAALTRLFDYYLGTASAAMDLLYPAERHRRPGSLTRHGFIRPLDGPDAARAWLDAERTCLAAVTEYAWSHGWPDHTTRIAFTLLSYLDHGGYFAEARAIHDSAQRAARQAGDQGTEAVALCNLGIVDFRQGRYEQAAGHFGRALTLFREAGDDIGCGRACNNLAMIDGYQGRFDRAGQRLADALAWQRKAGDRFGVARTLSNLGIWADHQGDYERASHYHERALALCAQIRDQTGEGLSLSALGEIRLRSGDHDEAVGNYQRALALFGETGNRHGEIVARDGLGAAFLASGQLAEARDQYTTALDLATANGEVYEQARAHDGLARYWQARPDSEQARRHWQAALARYISIGATEADQIRELLRMSVPS